MPFEHSLPYTITNQPPLNKLQRVEIPSQYMQKQHEAVYTLCINTSIYIPRDSYVQNT